MQVAGILAIGLGAPGVDRLRQPGNGRIRPLRGSHLLLPSWRLPVAHAFSFMHAVDGRPVFVFPWEGATVIGTTDLDHGEALNRDARITEDEVEYLLAACASVLTLNGWRTRLSTSAMAGELIA